MEGVFRELGLAPRTGLALTGVRADVAGRAGPGPTFALMGELDGLVVSGVLDHLAGRVAFMAVPAEEGGDLEWRLEQVRAGRLEFLGGKCELLRLGHLDDVDLAMMIHTTPRPDDGAVAIPRSTTAASARRCASSAAPPTPAAPRTSCTRLAMAPRQA